jgi:hypothetical protein
MTIQECKAVISRLKPDFEFGLLPLSIRTEIESLIDKGSKKPQADMVDRNQAAVILGGDKPLSRVTLHNYELAGKLKPFKIAGARLVRYKRADVLSLLESSENGGVK